MTVLLKGGLEVRSFRFWITLAGTIIVAISILTITEAWIGDLKFDLPTSTDKVTRINTVVAASAYIAAIVAAIFALVAYWQANGLPSLEPEISFLPYNMADPEFLATFRQPPPPWVDVTSPPFVLKVSPGGAVLVPERPGSEIILTVVLRNKTKYAARNPGLQIRFDGLLFNNLPAQWTAAERWGEKNGLRAMQWDGGVDYIVHGKWSRTLPIVGFSEFVVTGTETPKLTVTVVADGCRPKEFGFPLDVREL